MKEIVMVVRTLTLLTLATVLTASSGCSGMRNFLFGRGARCGLCARVGAVGQALNPLAPTPNVATTPRSGCGLFGGGATPAPQCNPGPVYAPVTGYAPMAGGCNTCSQMPMGSEYPCAGGCNVGGYSAAMGGDCGCSVDSGYSYGNSVDPYLGSGVTYGESMVPGETIVPGSMIPGASMGSGVPYGEGYIQGDGFVPRSYSSRKVDARGDVIINESPLPPGAQLIN